MDINTAFPSKFLKADDLQGREVAVQMDEVLEEEMPDGEMRPLLKFRGKQKGVVLNKTNAQTIAELYGSETAAWSGKWITLFPTQTEFRGKAVLCIRVKLQPPTDVPQPPADTPVEPTQPPADQRPSDIPF